VFPLVFGFFTSVTPEGVKVMTDISSYLDFILTIFLAFAIVFEIPVLIFLLIWTGITSPNSLAKKRPYVIVSCFILGMLLTPPDVISQTLLALPAWFLFEVGLLLSRIFIKNSTETREQESD
jgi:sec-independent protein translocase protein TatC